MLRTPATTFSQDGFQRTFCVETVLFFLYPLNQQVYRLLVRRGFNGLQPCPYLLAPR